VDITPPEILDLAATPAFINLAGYALVSATVVDPQLCTVYLIVASGEEIALSYLNITETNLSDVYSGTWNATQRGMTNGTHTEMPVTTKKEGELYLVDGYFQQNQTASEENATAVFYANYSLKAVYPYPVNGEPMAIEPGSSTFKPYNINISTEPHGFVNLTTLIIGNGTTFKLVHGTSPDGIYTVGIEANDTLGNENSSYAEVTVDTTLPKVSLATGPSGTIEYNEVTFAWSGSDDQTETSKLMYQYKLAGAWSAWTSATSVTYNDLLNDDYTFTVKVKDQAGNEATPAARSFTVSVSKKGGGSGGGGGGPSLDSDGDGYWDSLEQLMGTDPNDPNDYPNQQTAPSESKSASKSKPMILPSMSGMSAVQPSAPAPTPTPTLEAPTPEEPGFEAVFTLSGMLAVAYLVLRGKRK
jgi:hypothetical protein